LKRDLRKGADYGHGQNPACFTLISARVKSQFWAPHFCYQVSGEYSHGQGALRRNGWIDEERVMMES